MASSTCSTVGCGSSKARRCPPAASSRAATGKEQTLASMEKIDGILKKERAQLWINHDKAQRDSLKMAPEYYE